MLIPFSAKRKIFLTFRDIPKIGVLQSMARWLMVIRAHGWSGRERKAKSI